MRRQHLHRHRPLQPRVPRLVDLPHPARAERRQDLVGTEAGASRQSQRVPPFRMDVQFVRMTAPSGSEPGARRITRKRCPSGDASKGCRLNWTSPPVPRFKAKSGCGSPISSRPRQNGWRPTSASRPETRRRAPRLRDSRSESARPRSTPVSWGPSGEPARRPLFVRTRRSRTRKGGRPEKSRDAPPRIAGSRSGERDPRLRKSGSGAEPSCRPPRRRRAAIAVGRDRRKILSTFVVTSDFSGPPLAGRSKRS